MNSVVYYEDVLKRRVGERIDAMTGNYELDDKATRQLLLLQEWSSNELHKGVSK